MEHLGRKIEGVYAIFFLWPPYISMQRRSFHLSTVAYRTYRLDTDWIVIELIRRIQLHPFVLLCSLVSSPRELQFILFQAPRSSCLRNATCLYYQSIDSLYDPLRFVELVKQRERERESLRKKKKTSPIASVDESIFLFSLSFVGSEMNRRFSSWTLTSTCT